jgi:hypothetical protein
MKLNTPGFARASAIIALTLFMSTASSHATLSGSLWENFTSNNADTAPVGSPNVTFTSSQLHYDSTLGGYTIGTWLNSAGTTSTILTGAGEAGKTMNNTLVRLTGQIYLTAGLNSFTVGHDDGLNINVSGIGTVLDAPTATSPVTTPFSITAPTTGVYNFTINYNECLGAPAVLEWAFPTGPAITGGVPDTGTTIGLLGMSLTGLAAFARRFRK